MAQNADHAGESTGSAPNPLARLETYENPAAGLLRGPDDIGFSLDAAPRRSPDGSGTGSDGGGLAWSGL